MKQKGNLFSHMKISPERGAQSCEISDWLSNVIKGSDFFLSSYGLLSLMFPFSSPVCFFHTHKMVAAILCIPHERRAISPLVNLYFSSGRKSFLKSSSTP